MTLTTLLMFFTSMELLIFGACFLLLGCQPRSPHNGLASRRAFTNRRTTSGVLSRSGGLLTAEETLCQEPVGSTEWSGDAQNGWIIGRPPGHQRPAFLVGYFHVFPSASSRCRNGVRPTVQVASAKPGNLSLTLWPSACQNKLSGARKAVEELTSASLLVAHTD